MISNEQLAELERLTNEATEGPWDAPKDVHSGAYYGVKTQADVSHYRTRDICAMPLACPDDCIDNGYDARFIAAARTAMPQLIKAVRYLRKRLEEAHASDNDDMIEQGANRHKRR